MKLWSTFSEDLKALKCEKYWTKFYTFEYYDILLKFINSKRHTTFDWPPQKITMWTLRKKLNTFMEQMKEAETLKLHFMKKMEQR